MLAPSRGASRDLSRSAGRAIETRGGLRKREVRREHTAEAVAAARVGEILGAGGGGVSAVDREDEGVVWTVSVRLGRMSRSWRKVSATMRASSRREPR
jgi:hypothetical protein